LKVAIVSSEAAPFSKTGGLGDVAGSLPRALSALGADVLTISPLHRSVRSHRPEPLDLRLEVPLGGEIQVGTVARSGPNYFIGHDAYFDRDGLYGTPEADYADNAARFIFFSRAALELLRVLGAPDVVHAHDWQAGLIPIYLRTLYAADFPRARSVLTIHNLAYQGTFWHWDMPLTGLDWSRFNWREMEFHGKINLLKAGIVHADAVTTVSPTYAREIQTPEHGWGLDGVLRDRAADLHGILNGADYGEWNPARDPHLAATYSPHSPAGKARCKAALQERCGLAPQPEAPLAGMVGRLAHQKGVDLFLAAADGLLAEGLQVVLLGAGERALQEAVLALARRAPGRFWCHVGFDNALAHQIEAGSDLFVMPSRFEPCGLNQIYSLKYGTVPVVRATGGLADTVEDGVTGFTFLPPTPEALSAAVRRAVSAFRDRPAWKQLMTEGMRRDFSWTASARRYLALYDSLVAR
jgi:starch synthase